MKYSRQLLVVFGTGGAMLVLLLPGCALPIGWRETLPPPVVAPQVKEEVPKAEGPKVEQVGNASWYGPAQDGEETASGEVFDQKKLTAAHRTLPMGTKAVVTNLETGKSVTVKINDRGPYTKGRKIDLSHAAAQQIGMSEKGVAKVKIETRRRRKPTAKLARPTTTRRATTGETPTATPVPSPQVTETPTRGTED
jgi:rare lipoprotein A (peptidoglycan hydrolase)